MGSSRREFTDEFKAETVRLVQETAEGIGEADPGLAGTEAAKANLKF